MPAIEIYQYIILSSVERRSAKRSRNHNGSLKGAFGSFTTSTGIFSQKGSHSPASCQTGDQFLSLPVQTHRKPDQLDRFTVFSCSYCSGKVSLIPCKRPPHHKNQISQVTSTPCSLCSLRRGCVQRGHSQCGHKREISHCFLLQNPRLLTKPEQRQSSTSYTEL